MDVSETRLTVLREAAEAMARRIALAYEISKPMSPLAAVIPGRFIYDHIMRGRQVEWSKQRYVPIRLEAMHLASRTLAGDAPVIDEDETGPYQELLRRLARHYEPLLQAEGAKVEDVVRAAFPRPVDLEVEWREILELEEAVDRQTLGNQPNDDKLEAMLSSYRTCAEEQRERFVQELYY